MKEGRCEYSGQPTKGGKFVPGFDAKLKSALMDAASAGDIEAGAEAVAREWVAASRWPTIEHKIRAITERSKDSVSEFVLLRTQARWALIEDGVDPRTAVSKVLAEHDLAKAAAKAQAAAAKAAAKAAAAKADEDIDVRDYDGAEDDDSEDEDAMVG